MRLRAIRHADCTFRVLGEALSAALISLVLPRVLKALEDGQRCRKKKLHSPISPSEVSGRAQLQANPCLVAEGRNAGLCS